MTLSSQTMASLPTEQRNPRSMNLDRMTARQIIELIHSEDYIACKALDSQIDNLEHAVEMIVSAFQRGGRLIYVGAGTSGRLGVLDASECPPTFSSDPEMVQGVIAGGWDALRRSIERAEDSPEDGMTAIRERNVDRNDVVAGIAASSTTPFVLGALQEARARGAKTVFITCNPESSRIADVDEVIALETGPEVITGSTRMKAGTATKMVLNILTTAAMVRIGKVYENLMVDLTATNRKLEDRSRRIICMLTDLSYEEADALIRRAQGRVKTALVMHLLGVEQEQAEQLIVSKQGRIQDVIPR